MTIDRRTLLALLWATPLAVAAAPARAIGEREARREFAKLLAMLDRGDVPAFLAYGPPRLIVDKKEIGRDELPAFFAQGRAGDHPDKPIRIDGKVSRVDAPAPFTGFRAVTKGEQWQEQYCEQGPMTTSGNHLEECTGPGYLPRYDFWELWFEGPKITKLVRHMTLA
jgi:hypothetical protein